MKTSIDRMQRENCQPQALRQCLKCGARTRNGSTCRSPAVAGKQRCRMHGGAGGCGGSSGKQNGRYRNGERTQSAIANHRKLAGLVRMLRESAKAMTDCGIGIGAGDV